MKGKKITGYVLTMLLAAGLAAGAGNVRADETEEGLLIEEGGVEVSKEGQSLEELDAQEERERQEAERLAEQERLAQEALLEDLGLVLEPASAEELQGHLDYLLQTESPIGSDGELIVADYIATKMEEYGYTVSTQDFHEGFINENGVDAPGINVIAERGPDAKERSERIFVISTHYDSKTNPEEDDPFANDKTGAAVLLETARILSGLETGTDICFVFYSGEEDGLYGSAQFADFAKEKEGSDIFGAIHVELAGYAPDYPYILKTLDGEAREPGERFLEAAAWTQTMFDPEQKYVADDQSSHASLENAGIPAVTVTQDVENLLGREETSAAPEEITADIEKLQDVADILAACVGQIMTE